MKEVFRDIVRFTQNPEGIQETVGGQWDCTDMLVICIMLAWETFMKCRGSRAQHESIWLNC